MSGTTLTIRPAARPALPMGWAGPRGYVPPSTRGAVSKGALLGIIAALVLGAGGTAAAVAVAPPSPPTLACSSGGTVAKLSDEQRRNANEIIAVGRSMGAPPRAQIVAVATAAQESTLRNLDGGDRDSAGLFQQRPSQGWGSWSKVTTPRLAAQTFYERLLALKGWERMKVTVAAQTVQRSAYPDAYAKWEPLATSLVAGTTCEKR